MATPLWAGGEDICYATIGTGMATDTTAGRFRSAWCRCAVTSPNVNNSNSLSATFQGGTITSCWMSVRIYNGAQTTSMKNIGLRDSSTGGCLVLGTNSSTATKLVLYKYDGTTATALSTESGTSLTNTSQDWIVMQLVNYGASSNVNVYVNGVLVIAFSGNCTISSATSLNQVILPGNTTFQNRTSEIIVSDSDVRGLPGLATLALTSNGTTNSWTNPTFSNINAIAFTDATPTNSNTNAQDNEYNVTDLPTGTFSILGVHQFIRAATSATPTVTQIKMGYNSGGTTGFGTGSSKTPATTYGQFSQLDVTNPVTAVAFVQSEMNALQLDYQSLT